MMMKKILGIALMVLCMQAAYAGENLYEKHYKAQNQGNLKSLHANPDTKMYVSNHYDEDNISMLERGYDMMGSSGFEAGSITPDDALTHAKSIKADVVLVYSKYASKKSSLSALDTIKEAAKTTGEIDPEVLEDAEQYKYYASYWAKLPMPSLGLHVIKLKQKNKKTGDSVDQEGLKVLAVIRNSPAFKAGLLRGDVILRVADVETETPAKLSQAVRMHQGQQVKIVYKRDDIEATTNATLGGR